MTRPIKTFSGSFTVANGAAVSSSIDTKNRSIGAITTPAALTNTSWTLEMSEDNTTWFPVYKDDGTQYTITVSASQARFINLDYFSTNCMRYVRLKASGNEGGARTFRYHLRIVR